jgi:microcystin-dependent protein
MLEIEAASVVSGEIDVSGHLILETHGGDEIDAGYALVAVPDASTTVRGAVELATQAETEAATDSTRAVTPAGLDSTIDRITAVEGVANTSGRQLNPASFNQATLLSAYPQGMSYLYMQDTEAVAGGWSFGSKYGVVVTYRNGSDLAIQTWYYHATGDSGSPPSYIWTRSANNPSGWSPWSQISTPKMPETMGITGEVKIWPVSTIPAGWLLCDGSAVSRSTYSALFAILSTTYGVGDGSTTFNLPNAKGRSIVGYDSSQTEFDALGETGGAKTVTLTTAEMPVHTHVQNAHSHTMQGTGGSGALTDSTGITNYNVSGTTTTYGFKTNQPGPQTAVNQNAGSGGAHNNLSPYLTMNYIIKY